MRPLDFRIFACTAMLLLVASGCTATVSQTELRSAAKSVEGDTLGSVYYLGRSNGYDYFNVGRNVGSDNYRIAVPNDIVREPIPYGATPVLVGPFAPDRWLP
jgi:hypothetical protein